MTDTATTSPALADLDDLIDELRALRAEPSPLVRARTARSMDLRVKSVLARVGDESVFQSTLEVVGARRRSHREIAAALGVHVRRVSNAVTDYRAWVEGGAS